MNQKRGQITSGRTVEIPLTTCAFARDEFPAPFSHHHHHSLTYQQLAIEAVSQSPGHTLLSILDADAMRARDLITGLGQTRMQPGDRIKLLTSSPPTTDTVLLSPSPTDHSNPTAMRFTLLLGVCLMAALAYGQLIIDKDDPAGKKLIDLMMKAINEHEKSTYHFKSVVYSIPIGDNKKIQVLMKVTNAAGVSVPLEFNGNSIWPPTSPFQVEHTCTVELVGKDKEHYAAGAVHCKV